MSCRLQANIARDLSTLTGVDVGMALDGGFSACGAVTLERVHCTHLLPVPVSGKLHEAVLTLRWFRT